MSDTTHHTKDVLLQTLEAELKGFEAKVSSSKVGTVTEVGDGIAKLSGLGDCLSAEMLEFGKGVMGVALKRPRSVL
jgi:F-type H+/Na+-transporting ATPase subunit alpha